MPKAPTADLFILSAFDRDQWCPVLQTCFPVDDLEALKSILGEAAKDDPELRKHYQLDDDELSAVITRFAVPFDPTEMPFEKPDIFLFRRHRTSEPPYLVHTGYELPLLLNGTKKLAYMYHEYPPGAFEGEDHFDHWVSAGVLSKSESSDPFDKPIKGWLGVRKVYYTPVGEEWRVPAMQLLYKASERSGGWNEHFERLQGMLFGYRDADNDWWINVGHRGGGFGGAHICCAVSLEGLAWIETAGFRALPPSDKPIVKMCAYSRESEDELRDLLFEDPSAAAFVRFSILGRHLMNVGDLRTAGPWDIPSDRVPSINQHLRGAVIVVARRILPAGSSEAGIP